MGKRPQAVEWLDDLVAPAPPRGADALARARALVEALGSPQRHAPAVHIVGTAGKGSVAARLTARLVAAGLHVATHQSPHVYDVRERFLIDGALPTWPEVERGIDQIEAALSSDGPALEPPTFFAATAALSWLLGRDHDVDVFITEAGIGGRHDATAVLDRADTLTVITHVGLDHTEVLGETVAEIAAEKAAVLAGRRVAVLGPQSDPAAVRVIRETAAAHGVALIEAGPTNADWRLDADATVDAVALDLEATLGRALPPVETPATPGRFEIRSLHERRVILDGAHNPLKFRALAATTRATPPDLVVAAVAATKDLDACAGGLVALGAPIVATEFTGSSGRRSRSAVDLAAAIERVGGQATVAADPPHAVRHAVAVTEPGSTILVTGSFLLLGEVVDAFATTG